MGTAISHHVFGDPPSKLSSLDMDPVQLHRRGREATRTVFAESADFQSLAETDGEVMDDESDLLSQSGALDGAASDSDGSMLEADTGSEMEWDGWAQDVQRRRDEVFTKLKEEREKNSIRWDSNWAWGINSPGHGEFSRSVPEDSISPRADQMTFSTSGRSPEAASSSSSSRGAFHRSVTSYASADSLYKRTIKRNNSKREPAGTVAHVIGTTSRAETGSDSIDGQRERPRSPLSAEFDEEGVEEDSFGHEPKYTYASSSSPQFPTQPSSSRQQFADMDSDTPFNSYIDSSQRLPRSLTMTTISSVVSVGGREDAQSKKKKKDGQKSRESRRSVLTAPLIHAASSFGRSSDRGGSSKAFGKSKSTQSTSEQQGETDSHSSSHRPAKPKLSMNLPLLPAGQTLSASGQHLEPPSAVSAGSSVDWESPRFATPDMSD